MSAFELDNNSAQYEQTFVADETTLGFGVTLLQH